MAKQQSHKLYPCGVTRREFVWEMGGGFAGLALTSLLAADGFFARHTRIHSASDNYNSPLALNTSTRSPHLGRCEGISLQKLNFGCTGAQWVR